MIQKYILPFVILYTLVFLALSSLNAKDYDPDVNFWPIFYSSREEDEKVIEILYPFFSLRKNDTGSIVAFRPVYSRKRVPKEKYRRSDVLWPLSYAVHSGSRTYKRAFPFYSYTKDTAGKVPEKDITFFPFFFSRNYNGKDFAVFPFYGTFHHRFGQDMIQFTLWPVYTKVVKGDRHSWNIIWPIFNYSKSGKGDEYGYKFWPFYGKRKKKAAYEKGFIMWPLYVYIKADIENRGEYKGWGSIPFYVSEKTPVSNSQSVLWPLFNHIKDTRGLERWDYPFPIATRIKSEKRNKNSFLPFWLVDRTPGSETLSIVFPLFWKFHYETGVDDKIDTVRFLPFYWQRDEYLIKEKKHAGLRQIWPFYKQKKEFNHSTSLEVLSLYPLFDDEPWERNWQPFFTLYGQRNNKATDTKTIRFLWRLFHRENSPKFFYLETAPFFSFYKGSDSKDVCLSLFCNMIQYKKNEADRYVKLFYLLKIPMSTASTKKSVENEK